MKTVILLGVGSIGSQTIDVLRKDKKFKLVGISFGHDLKYAKDIYSYFKPKYVCFKSKELSFKTNEDTEVYYGNDGLEVLATKKADILINALVSSVGLKPTIKAIETKKDILLANKEVLVLAGSIIKDLVKKNNVKLIPIDSEHSSILSIIDNINKDEIKNIVITASGGAFRDKKLEDLKNVTKEDALRHPNWKMGNKITIDSATMMNKGFEVIEASYLFDIPASKIKTILHKESIVHALVLLKNNEYILSMSKQDMRLCISYALNYPNKVDNLLTEELSLFDLSLNFQELSLDRFKMLSYAYQALEEGKFKQVYLQAANDACVELFLNDKIKFLDIEKIVSEYINKECNLQYNIDNIIKLEKLVKEEIIKKYGD